MAETNELPLCACGCGERVRRAGARFILGHHTRTKEWREPRYGPRITRDCPVCGKSTVLHPSQVEGFTACGPACFAQLRSDLKPWNPLQRRVFGYMRAHQPPLSFAGFARLAGVHPSGLRWWVKRPGSSTSGETLTRLAAVLGLSEEQAHKEAGGQTAHDVHLRVGRDQAQGPFATNRLLGYSPEVVKRRAAAQTGLKRSAETKAKIRAGNRAPELVARARERMRAWHMNLPGQALTRLGHLLAREPEPTPDRRLEWEARIAGELGAKPRVIREIWRPTFFRLGLIREQGGRPTLETRHRILEEFMEDEGETPWSPKPRGFWDRAALRLRQRDPRDVTDGPTLRTWYAKHVKVCRHTYFAPRGATRE